MKLDIYDKKVIVKTYEIDKYSLKFGTLKEFFKIINLDDLKTGSDDEIVKLVAKSIPNSIDLINYLIKDMFEEITDEELDNAKIKDIVVLVVDVIKYAITEMSLGINQKK